jgi:hypothetical protein
VIGIDIHAPDGSAVHLPAAKITAATYHSATGRLALTYTDTGRLRCSQHRGRAGFRPVIMSI